MASPDPSAGSDVRVRGVRLTVLAGGLGVVADRRALLVVRLAGLVVRFAGLVVRFDALRGLAEVLGADALAGVFAAEAVVRAVVAARFG